MTIRVYSWTLLIVLIAGWELYCRVSGISALVIPAPSAVMETLWSGLMSGYLLPHIWITVAEMVLGLAAGCAIGFFCGIVLGETEFLRRLLYPYIIASQVVPKLALGPLFIVWFGA